jgi:hypothetical protein
VNDYRFEQVIENNGIFAITFHREPWWRGLWRFLRHPIRWWRRRGGRFLDNVTIMPGEKATFHCTKNGWKLESIEKAEVQS